MEAPSSPFAEGLTGWTAPLATVFIAAKIVVTLASGKMNTPLGSDSSRRTGKGPVGLAA